MYIPVIGLEIHLQLKTKSKMFCGCPNREETVYGAAPPNSFICPVCTGQPGVLPIVNQQAIAWAVKMARALNCRLNPVTKFDRKHYFYPDLPKGYQISQYDLPVAENGELEIDIVDENEQPRRKKVNLIRLHVEEDAAKLTHEARHPEQSEGSPSISVKTIPSSYVDFNRAGAPLVEIVTQAELSSPAEAKTFLQEIRLLARYLEISQADMEKGEMRCDANISLRPKGEAKFYPKTEIKNLNSFKAVERALEYEIIRQTKLWEQGNPPAALSTRGWNDVKQITEEQRVKEEAEDYRYFPEPDLPALDLSEAIKEARNLPELPARRRVRFAEEYGLSRADARILTDNLAWANFTEKVFAEAWAWLASLPEMEGTEEEIMKKNRAKLGRLLGGWLTSKLAGLMLENKIDIRLLKITPENFAEFISLIYTNKINSANAQILLKEMLLAGADPSQIMEEKQLGQVDDPRLIEKAAETVLRLNPDQAAQYRAGKEAVLQFFIGKVMKETEGKVDPQAVKKILEEKLKRR